MAKPEEYKHIRAWGKFVQSFNYYILNEQMKAAQDGAPLTAIYYSDQSSRWITFEEIQSNETADQIAAMVNAMEAK